MTKYIGYGVQLQASTDALGISAVSGASFTTLAQIRSLEGPAVEGSEVEATCLDSPDAFREFLSGLLDPGNATFDIAWDSTLASHRYITNGQQARNLHNFKILLANTSNATASTLMIFFNGRFMSFSPSFPLDEVQTASVSIRVTGPVRWPST